MIRGIYFDIGGVIVNDHALRQRARDLLGIQDAEAFWRVFNEAALPACRGEEPLSEAWKRVGVALGIPVPDEVARSLWNSDYEEHIKIDFELLKLITELGKTIKTGVISNTVAEHASVLRKLGVYDPFDEVILSHEIGATKDAPRIFELALLRMDLPARTVAFVDDVEKFRAVAADHGIEAILYTGLPDLRLRLQQLELL